MLVLLSCQLEALNPPATSSPTTSTTKVTPDVAATQRALSGTQPPPPSIVPTQLPEPTPIPTPQPVNGTAKDNLNVRAAPSTSGAILDKLTKGATVQIVGRTAGNDWLQIALPKDPNQRVWVSAQFVDVAGALDTVPVQQPGGTNPPPTSRPYPYP